MNEAQHERHDRTLLRTPAPSNATGQTTQTHAPLARGVMWWTYLTSKLNPSPQPEMLKVGDKMKLESDLQKLAEKERS